jgi:hypothetical protein
VPDAAGEVALEAADGIAGALAFLAFAVEVGLRFGVASRAGDGDACSAALIWRFPPRSRRWRTVRSPTSMSTAVAGTTFRPIRTYTTLWDATGEWHSGRWQRLIHGHPDSRVAAACVRGPPRVSYCAAEHQARRGSVGSAVARRPTPPADSCPLLAVGPRLFCPLGPLRSTGGRELVCSTKQAMLSAVGEGRKRDRWDPAATRWRAQRRPARQRPVSFWHAVGGVAATGRRPRR